MVRIDKISKHLGRFSLNEISFSIGKGDYLVLLGESGAGKTLLLELMAGIYAPDSGRILLDGNDVSHDPIQNRGFGLVFQDLALFPHLTVKQNIQFPLKMKKTQGNLVHDKTMKIAAELEISDLLDRHPSSLSGGQKQRVALARTLISQPKCLLLDEPLTALDTRLKLELKAILKRINEQGQTIIHVTHAYEEALFLSSHIGFISKGSLIQFGTRQEVLNDPKDPWISDYIRNFKF